MGAFIRHPSKKIIGVNVRLGIEFRPGLCITFSVGVHVFGFCVHVRGHPSKTSGQGGGSANVDDLGRTDGRVLLSRNDFFCPFLYVSESDNLLQSSQKE